LFQKPISSEKLAQLKQKYTPAQIDEGKTISMNSCKKCHRYHQASEFTARKWDKILVKMVRKAHLSLDSAREVHAYYLLNAKQG
jgi:nitrate/TMAO reductase-like tetraheme cytochrome c subunit